LNNVAVGSAGDGYEVSEADVRNAVTIEAEIAARGGGVSDAVTGGAGAGATGRSMWAAA
jgi:hypothetical protein